MNLQTLLQQYQNNERVLQLTHRLSFAPTEQSSEKIFLKNLQGSSAEFIVASVFAHPNTQGLNHLVVLNDAEEAAYFQNTLENLTSALDLFYFPSSFKNRKNFKLLNSSHVMLRTEALTKLSAGGNKKIIVTYPEALFEKVVLPKTLSGNIISVKVNDTISLESLLELFSLYGFRRSDFVYEPGQYALRGGILDIYSFGNEKPYRVELFGNEVDSIRIFDPETQLSERKLLQVSIIPNVETQFNTGEKVSLLEFLPENTIVWLKDWDVIKEKMEVQEEDLGLFLERTKADSERLYAESEKLKEEGMTKKAAALLETEQDEDDETQILKEVSLHDFSPAATIERQIQQRHIVEFGYKPYFTSPQPLSTGGEGLLNNSHTQKQ